MQSEYWGSRIGASGPHPHPHIYSIHTHKGKKKEQVASTGEPSYWTWCSQSLAAEEAAAKEQCLSSQTPKRPNLDFIFKPVN